jgi:hypothetical protein
MKPKKYIVKAYYTNKTIGIWYNFYELDLKLINSLSSVNNVRYIKIINK